MLKVWGAPNRTYVRKLRLIALLCYADDEGSFGRKPRPRPLLEEIVQAQNLIEQRLSEWGYSRWDVLWLIENGLHGSEQQSGPAKEELEDLDRCLRSAFASHTAFTQVFRIERHLALADLMEFTQELEILLSHAESELGFEPSPNSGGGDSNDSRIASPTELVILSLPFAPSVEEEEVNAYSVKLMSLIDSLYEASELARGRIAHPAVALIALERLLFELNETAREVFREGKRLYGFKQTGKNKPSLITTADRDRIALKFRHITGELSKGDLIAEHELSGKTGTADSLSKTTEPKWFGWRTDKHFKYLPFLLPIPAERLKELGESGRLAEYLRYLFGSYVQCSE